MGLIELSGVRKDFGGLIAVEAMDLDIEVGEVRGLIGPNGSGKTTLLNLMSGWLKPTRGSVMWRDRNVTGLPPFRLAQRGIGRTFQLPTFFSEMTGLENVMMGFYAAAPSNPVSEVLGLPSQRKVAKSIEARALSLMEMFGILEIKNEVAANLPLGYQRWLGIAMALAMAPELLMLDEPLGGMNPVERRVTMEKIGAVSDSGITILLVEHDMHAVMNACRKITVMNAGQKIAEGSPSEVRNNQAVIDAYLGKDDVYA